MLRATKAIPLGRRHDSEDHSVLLSFELRGVCPGQEETEARVWILHSDAAKVIGRGGRALREIENRTEQSRAHHFCPTMACLPFLLRTRTRIKVSREEDMNPDTKAETFGVCSRTCALIGKGGSIGHKR